MSTPRQIKASEVRKGMRVRVERNHPEIGPRLAHTVVFEGVVSEATAQRFTIFKDSVNDYTFWGDSNVPTTITVLADPEPEWVEGAWYWVEVNGKKTIARRVEGGWVRWDGVSYPSWEDIDRSRVVTALGRVLIVDWPGDDVARELDAINDGNRSTSLSNYGRTTTHDTILGNVADAIRTQGGVR